MWVPIINGLVQVVVFGFMLKILSMWLSGIERRIDKNEDMLEELRERLPKDIGEKVRAGVAPFEERSKSIEILASQVGDLREESSMFRTKISEIFRILFGKIVKNPNEIHKKSK